MTSEQVPRGGRAQLGRVEGDLEVGPNATIAADATGRVVVTGTARFRGSATIESPFECANLEVDGGTVEFRRELQVHDDLTAEDARVEVFGALTGHRIDVGKTLILHRTSTAERFEVGGVFEAREGLNAETVRVGGALRVAGVLKGGSVEAGG